MPATRLHLVRHGEVYNPDGVLYGRLPHYALSDLGHTMATLAGQELAKQGRKITALYASPLLRTRESAERIQEVLKASGNPLELQIEDRVIEPYNIFEGKKLSFGKILIRPNLWFHLRNPYKPTWGEPFTAVADRVLAAMNDAYDSVSGGDVVLVSHQMPIWVTHRRVLGEPLAHDPRKRRCALSSITSFERHNGRWVEVDYRDPSFHLRGQAIDTGAV